MNKSRKKTAVLFAYIFVILGIWMMLSVHCQVAETNNDEKQPQTIRVGSFEDMAMNSCRLCQAIPDGNLSM